MFTYTILNLAVIAVLALALTAKVLARKHPANLHWRHIAVLALALCLMTAGFDSILVGAHIVAYHRAHILGIYIGKAPLEDFAYTLVAAVLLPCLWTLTGPNHEK